MFQINLQKIKELRKQQGLSQQQLAEKLHIEQAAYSKIETGVSYASVDLLFRLAKLLNTSPETLVHDTAVTVNFNDNSHNTGIVNVQHLENFNSFPPEFVQQWAQIIKQVQDVYEKMQRLSSGLS